MYSITEDKTTIENEEKTVYGIYYDNEYYIKDVSPNKAEVERLVRLFNQNNLAPYQMYDAICDVIDC